MSGMLLTEEASHRHRRVKNISHSSFSRLANEFNRDLSMAVLCAPFPGEFRRARTVHSSQIIVFPARHLQVVILLENLIALLELFLEFGVHNLILPC